MLYAFKNELHAQLSRELISVRSRELEYYTTNIRNIGFSAALLTGFAFSTLAAHKSSNMLAWLNPIAKAYEGAETTPPFIFIYAFELGAMRTLEAWLEMFWLSINIAAMGLTIYTLYICLLLSITGSGLALRGPEGSVHRAVLTLARGCRRVIQAYALALYLFMLSIFTKAFLSYHVYLAAICGGLLVYYAYAIRTHTRGVLRMFRIEPHQLVTGHFEVERLARGALGDSVIFPTLADMLRDMSSSLRRRIPFGRSAAEAAPAEDEPELSRPSRVARDMVGLHQSPHLSGAGGLDGWFESVYGADHLADRAKAGGAIHEDETTRGSDGASSSSRTGSALSAQPRAPERRGEGRRERESHVGSEHALAPRARPRPR